jgi:hypothetical protein
VQFPLLHNRCFTCVRLYTERAAMSASKQLPEPTAKLRIRTPLPQFRSTDKYHPLRTPTRTLEEHSCWQRSLTGRSATSRRLSAIPAPPAFSEISSLPFPVRSNAPSASDRCCLERRMHAAARPVVTGERTVVWSACTVASCWRNCHPRTTELRTANLPAASALFLPVDLPSAPVTPAHSAWPSSPPAAITTSTDTSTFGKADNPLRFDDRARPTVRQQRQGVCEVGVTRGGTRSRWRRRSPRRRGACR